MLGQKPLLATALAAAAVALGGAPTYAANDDASCVGAGSSSIAPGQGGPFSYPGSRADIQQNINALPGPPGAFVSTAAHEHGTVQECFPNGPPP